MSDILEDSIKARQKLRLDIAGYLFEIANAEYKIEKLNGEISVIIRIRSKLRERKKK